MKLKESNIGRMKRILLPILGAPGIAIIIFNLVNDSAVEGFFYLPYKQGKFYAMLSAIAIALIALNVFLRLFVKLDRKLTYMCYAYVNSSYVYLVFARLDFSRSDFTVRGRNYLVLLVLFLLGTIIIGIRHRLLQFAGNLNLIKDMYLSPPPVVLFLLALAVYVLFSLNFLFPQIGFVGDEPHYLIITHSLIHDRDLNVKNNYLNQDYLRFAGGKLKFQAVYGKNGESEWYSIHMPMISILLVPFYWIGSHWGQEALTFFIRFGMSLIGALLSVAFYQLLRKEFTIPIPLKVWAIFTLLPPIFFYSRQVYPETIVALLSVIAFASFQRGNKVVPSLLAGMLPFFGSKYLGISLGFLLIYLKDLYNRKEFRIAYKYIGWLLLTIAFLMYLKVIYGYNAPIAQYQGKAAQNKVADYLYYYLIGLDWRDRIGSFFSYFLDQRDGLIPYAPIYFFAFLGIVWAFKKSTARAYDLLLVAIPYICVYAFLTHRGGFCPPARPLVSVAWIFAYFIGYFYEHNRSELFKTLSFFSIIISLLILAYLVANPIAAYQATTHQITERGSALLTTLSNLYVDIPLYFPSFLKIEGAYWLPNYLWIVFLLGIIWYYLRLNKRQQKTSSSERIKCGLGLISFILLMIQFSCLPQLSLRGAPYAEEKDKNIRIYFFQKQISIEENMNFNYQSSKQLPMLIESKSRLDGLIFNFNKPKNLALKIHYFEKAATPFFADDTKILNLTYYYKVWSLYYYQIMLEPKCDEKMCPFGFNVKFFWIGHNPIFISR